MKFINQKLFKNLYALLFSLILLFYSCSVKANDNLLFNSEMIIERKLANKYCQSIDKNLFEGLDNELILKYEYFFSSFSKDSIENGNIDNFIKEVDSLCSYKLTNEEIKEFNEYFQKFFFK